MGTNSDAPGALSGRTSPQSILVRGADAKQVAIRAGLIPADASDEDFIDWIVSQVPSGPQGEPGAPGSQAVTIPIFINRYIRDSELLVRLELPDDYTMDADRSRASCEVAPTFEQMFGLTLNEASIGSVTFAANSTAGTVVMTDTGWDQASVLRLIGPVTADQAMEGVSITLVGDKVG